MLFSVALHPFLVNLQESYSSTRVMAYLDDMFFIGPLDDVLSCLNDVESSLKKIGLNIANKNVSCFVMTLQHLTLIGTFKLYLLVFVSWGSQLGNRSMSQSLVWTS